MNGIHEAQDPIKLANFIIKTSECMADRNQLKSFRLDESPLNLTPREFATICTAAKYIFSRESHLMQVTGPCNVVGDIHGQYWDLAKLFRTQGRPPFVKYIFLGDYVDRGKSSMEVITVLFAYKILYPGSIYLVRGNHEDEDVNELFGFSKEVKARYNICVARMFWDTFNFMSASAVIDSKYFCCHGGLSPHLCYINEIHKIVKPSKVPSKGVLCDLMWSDPDKTHKGYKENKYRGQGYTFGEDAVEAFTKRNNLKCVIRAHQCVDGGFEFFANCKLVTIFSAPNYEGEDNDSAIVKIRDGVMYIQMTEMGKKSKKNNNTNTDNNNKK